MFNNTKIPKCLNIGVKGSPERGYFVPACVGPGGGQIWGVVRVSCALLGLFREK